MSPRVMLIAALQQVVRVPIEPNSLS
jgi:hypothetical protein